MIVAAQVGRWLVTFTKKAQLLAGNHRPACSVPSGVSPGFLSSLNLAEEHIEEF
jgi:hypothetical protein